MFKLNALKISMLALGTASLIACNDADSQDQNSVSDAHNQVKKATEAGPSNQSPEAKNLATTGETTASTAPDTEARLRQIFKEQVGEVPIDRLQPSRMSGFYEIIAGRQIVYISEDGRFLFPGPVLEVSGNQLVSLTEASLREIDMEKAPERAELISHVDEKNMVVFKAPHEKHVLTVFTDVNCVYCRKLHQNMQGYLDQGITIRYLAFPRAGVGSPAYNKLVSVWCAEDRQQAMDNAKLHNKFDNQDCENPVADQYSLTRQLGLSGTPAIILSSGELISGFMEPEKLADYLNSQG